MPQDRGYHAGTPGPGATRDASTGRGFQNFADSDRLRDAEAYYGTNLPRLRDIRSHYDARGILSHYDARGILSHWHPLD